MPDRTRQGIFLKKFLSLNENMAGCISPFEQGYLQVQIESKRERQLPFFTNDKLRVDRLHTTEGIDFQLPLGTDLGLLEELEIGGAENIGFVS